MNDVEIREAILVSVDSKDKDILIKHLEYNIITFTTVRTINCVVDIKRNNAIDLETGRIFHILERDDSSRLDRKEIELIKNSDDNTLFVYSHYKKNMKDISMLHQLYMLSRAKDKYKEYMDGIAKSDVSKVKKIGTNKHNSDFGK